MLLHTFPYNVSDSVGLVYFYVKNKKKKKCRIERKKARKRKERIVAVFLLVTLWLKGDIPTAVSRLDFEFTVQEMSFSRSVSVSHWKPVFS